MQLLGGLHELRSPLARLNVALDLARERKGNDSAFDHIEQDIERMSEMIGRMTKSDSGSIVDISFPDNGTLTTCLYCLNTKSRRSTKVLQEAVVVRR
jgi:signal transduction histidine kinase